jgi:hypothetical protein
MGMNSIKLALVERLLLPWSRVHFIGRVIQKNKGYFDYDNNYLTGPRNIKAYFTYKV